MFQTQIHADDTGGVTWLGFPVLKLGFSDAARQFHLVLIALASDKTSKNYAFAAYTLRTKRPDLASVRFCMSDGAEAIYNGINEAFSTAIPGQLQVSTAYA